MTKTQLAENIIKSIEKSEWDKLQDGTLKIPVREHNRKVLLGQHGSGVDYTGEVCDKDVHRLSDAVYEFLKETWPDEPEAHKYVVLSCLVLTFLREEPMHPKDKVQYKIVERDGIKEYRALFGDCSVIIEKMSKGAIGANALKGIGVAGNAMGKLIGSMPKKKEATGDNLLQDKGQKLIHHVEEKQSDIIKAFAEVSNPNTGGLLNKMEDMVQIYGRTKEICFDKDNIYFIA